MAAKPDQIAERRIHVLACAVLRLDLEQTARELGISFTADYLPGGLHDRPWELKRRVQEAVDTVSKSSLVDMIALGYGLCGYGTEGIRSHSIPLAIPRVHDCIALFLGSDDAYRRQFNRYPGTYYVSAGWVEGRVQPLAEGPSQAGLARSGPSRAEYVRFLEEYGEENAEAIRHFLTSWQRNYQRAAFIDTGVRKRRSPSAAESGLAQPSTAPREPAADDRPFYEKMAQGMAEEFGWLYEKLPGKRDLLAELLTTEETTEGILLVPPNHTTALDAASGKLTALPAWEPGGAEKTTKRTFTTAESPKKRQDTTTGNNGDDPQDDASPGYGLGIDAGGTYTDVVVYDPLHNTVIQKAKAPTTRWDFAVGIEDALDRLEERHLSKVRFVAVSTTLATNSIVEGTGQTVGLLVMPPYGWTDLDNFKHTPRAIIDGQMETDGREITPINPEQVRRLAREMIDKHGVKAFAVAGYASHANPAHETAVKRILFEETGLPVTCGDDVSEGLNYRIRAETAALNASIIPYLEALFEKVRSALESRDIVAPMMVVKSDGSLTSLPEAVERPIETILSGPAASAAGAKYLIGCSDALVVDMGGTTTDTAIIRNGIIETCDEGAIVGGWETHVRALDMRTLGLGGDSLIALEERNLVIGPRRVIPVSYLSHQHRGVLAAIEWIERNLHYNETSTRSMEIVALNPSTDSGRRDALLDHRERKIVDALQERPMSLHELAGRTRWIAWQLLPIRGLVEKSVIQRSGLTPTDLLHAAGSMDLWSKEAAYRLCSLYSKIRGADPEAFAEEAIQEVVSRLALELFRKQLDETSDSRGLKESQALKILFDNAMRRRRDDWRVDISTSLPVIGIGAPIHQFLPPAAELLHTEAVIPPHADVANAIGAITSSVFVHKRVTISADETGTYYIKGLEDAPTFKNLKDAEAYAASELIDIVSDMAMRAGTSERTVEIITNDRIGSTADGGGVFLARAVEARVVGSPDLSRLAADKG